MDGIFPIAAIGITAALLAILVKSRKRRLVCLLPWRLRRSC
jgi:phosphotransferase system  glucose/maltose/N-acetylglucosamine-specific IIC component